MSRFAVNDYISVGGNRHSAASDWSKRSGLLAFGTDQNVAVWQPGSDDYRGIRTLLQGHADKVTAVCFLSLISVSETFEFVASGSADGHIILWKYDLSSGEWSLLHDVKAHEGAVNVLACLEKSVFLASGSADTSIKVWRFDDSRLGVLSAVRPKPRFIPLAITLGGFPNITSAEGFFIAAAGTRNDIQIFAVHGLQQDPQILHQATLIGHEGWIRSLSLKSVDNENGFLLASTSHDKYVRLWRFQSGDLFSVNAKRDPSQTASIETTLTAKVSTVSVGKDKYSIVFEALLLGHEDWVYSADWCPTGDKLLTASADGTLAIWEPDSTSGIWVSESRLGEISGQKGATTATGSSGGFWTGLWSPNGQSVTCLGRTGSWRLWDWDESTYYWNQRTGISGHTGPVNGLSWSQDGGYLLSTSSDQTTRLHAEWRNAGTGIRSWHEFSRPQIHGYDLNCVSHVGPAQFASGADEKLLRVFNEPREIADMLQRLCGIETPNDVALPETAAIPVLGLSNKVMGEPDDIIEAGPVRKDDYSNKNGFDETSVIDIQEPPTEDLLARHTLWPECEKLYGHGYEISESAYSNGQLATACKASSIDHASIRRYDAGGEWREIKPTLTAHSLTVTRLAWSLSPDDFLLSVGRDRQWTVFHSTGHRDNDRAPSREMHTLQSQPKAHTRMILDAAWSSVAGNPFFATAGRDKTVKLWAQPPPTSVVVDETADSKGQDSPRPFELRSTLTRPSAVTAISFTSSSRDKDLAVLAAGEEDGKLSLHVINIGKETSLSVVKSIELDSEGTKSLCPSKAVNRLLWRPNSRRQKTDVDMDMDNDDDDDGSEPTTKHLAVAAADGSLRVLAIDLDALVS